MSRLSGACLFAALLGLTVLAPRVTAKPPDLPTTIERVEPPAPTPELMDAFLRAQILRQQGIAVAPTALGGVALPPLPSPQMTYPPALPMGMGLPTSGVACPPAGCVPVCMPVPPPPAPSVSSEPTFEESLVKCILASIHPLLSLLPCEEWLDAGDGDHSSPPLPPAGMVMPCAMPPMPCIPPAPPMCGVPGMPMPGMPGAMMPPMPPPGMLVHTIGPDGLERIGVDFRVGMMPPPPPPPVKAPTRSLTFGVGVDSDMAPGVLVEFSKIGQYTIGGAWSAGCAPKTWFRMVSPSPKVVFAHPPMPCMPPLPPPCASTLPSPTAVPCPRPPMPVCTAPREQESIAHHCMTGESVCRGGPCPVPPPVVAYPPQVIAMPPAPVCPYLAGPMRGMQYVPVVEEIEIGDSVLANLKKMKKAVRLVKKAKDLSDKGDVVAAIECLEIAAKLCPGSRYEEMAQAMAEKMFIKMFDLPDGAEEQGENESQTPELLPYPTPCEEKKSEKSSKCKETIETPVRVGQIFIIGNERTKQKVIMRQLTDIYPGGILSYPALSQAEHNLANLGLFEVSAENHPTVTVIKPENEDCPFRDIRVEVTEKKSSTRDAERDAVQKLMKQCHYYIHTGQIGAAAFTAARAYAIAPEMVVADPLVYKLHLKKWHDEASKCQTGVVVPPMECPGVKLEVSLPGVDATMVQALDEVLQCVEKTVAEPKACTKSGCLCAAMCKACAKCCNGEKCSCAAGKCDCKSGGKCCCEDGKCSCGGSCKSSKCDCKGGNKCCCEDGKCECGECCCKDGKCCGNACILGACTRALGDVDIWMGLCQSLAGGCCHDVAVSADGVRLLFDFDISGNHYRLECDGHKCHLTVCPVCVEQE
jgi:hypothetical protein